MFYDYFFMKRITGLALCLSIMGSVAGCGASSAEMTAEETQSHGLSGSAKINYSAPVQTPGTLVDQVGYPSGSEKAVLFKAEEPPKEFYVCDLDSGSRVYTGEIQRSVYSESLSEYVCAGYFNELKTPGRYCIYTDELGESYSFSIGEDVYGDVFSEALRKYYVNRCGISTSESYAGEITHSACHTTMAHLQENEAVAVDVTGGWHMDETAGRDAALGSRIAETLLLAYEMNPSAFTDNLGIPESGNGIPDILDEVRYEAQWLLKMQDTKTGGVYGAAVTEGAKGTDVFALPVLVTPVSMDATISFAAMMGRFSFFYQQYDADFATTALKAADRAFSCFLNNQKTADNTAAFKAAAQLYRATGSDSYKGVLEECFERSDFEELFKKDENVFLGCVTYLTINQKVDVERCTYLMKLLMQLSEDIARRASETGYLVTDPADGDDFSEFLRQMRTLTITDHIIYNYEYTTIIENHIHYLAGMNPSAVNYLTSDTDRPYSAADRTGIMNNPESDALLIFILSVLEQ